MTFRLGCGFLLTSIFFAAAPAEVVRFQTDVGNIDMVLNPSNDRRLQEHVDNLIDYVEARRYHCTVVNRAAEGFVLADMFPYRSSRAICQLDSERLRAEEGEGLLLFDVWDFG